MRAASAVSVGAIDGEAKARAAKAFVGRYGSELMHECVQLHGGLGVTFEHDVHLFLRRHTVDRSLFGNAVRTPPGDHRPARLDHRRCGMSAETIEDLDSFRVRARAWVRAYLRRVGPTTKTLRNELTDDEELVGVARDREIQRQLFEAGLAGVCVPKEYGGQGLTPAHQQALREELADHEFPSRLQSPTFSPILAVLLEFGTEEQRLRHVPAILRGDEIWMQFLSEPSGGSDVAGALTSAVRDGDEWIMNGSKIWTTGAWWSDWALCLARTNWDVPKHRGLTVFMLPLRQPGIEVHRIEMLNGNREFCQEFMTDVRVPDSDRVGEVDAGWTVGTRWMFHERMLFNSPFTTIPTGSGFGSGGASALEIARGAGRLDDPVARDLVGEASTLQLVRQALDQRIGAGMRARTMSDQASAIGRLFAAICTMRMGDDLLRARGRCRWHVDRLRRAAGRRRYRLPHASGLLHRRRHHGDGQERRQRTGPGHATRTEPRQGHPVLGRPARSERPHLTPAGANVSCVSAAARSAPTSSSGRALRRRRGSWRRPTRCPCRRRSPPIRGRSSRRPEAGPG